MQRLQGRTARPPPSTLPKGTAIQTAALCRVELNAKRRFLRARGLRLRARSSKALEGLAAWLGARGLQLQLPSLLYAPALVLAPPLVVWQLCEAIVLIVSPDCRASARS